MLPAHRNNEYLDAQLSSLKVKLKEWMKPPHPTLSLRLRYKEYSCSCIPEPFFEGIRQSRIRGLCEHDMNNQTVMILAEEQRRMRTDKHAEFAGPKKVGEGMALKIWAERSHLLIFILFISNGTHYCAESRCISSLPFRILDITS